MKCLVIEFQLLYIYRALRDVMDKLKEQVPEVIMSKKVIIYIRVQSSMVIDL